MNIRRFQKKYQIDSGDLISFLRSVYPKFSKVALCMVSNPKKYGVKLIPKAERALKDRYAPPKAEKENVEHKVTLRLTEEEYNRIKGLLKGENNDTSD